MATTTAVARTARRDGIDVARVLALALVVLGHLTLAVIDRPHGEVRGANLLALHPGWALALAAAPMPVFFAAGGYANATASLEGSARRLRTLAGLVLVHRFGYAPALIDAVPGARSNTTPPTLYTAVAGLAQTGVLLMGARHLDRVGRRWRRLWDRAGEAAVGVYAWHLTALALCAAAVAAGLPSPTRLTALWWATRPLWWAAVLLVTALLVVATDSARRRLRSTAPPAATSAAPRWRLVLGVGALAGAGAGVGLEGPRSLPAAAAWSALFLASWALLRGVAGRTGSNGTMHFETYDPALAEIITADGGPGGGGLPDYLGIRTTEVGPGTMTAELPIRADLLNPFGSVHGGVLAALADHVLGAVLYPVIPRGSWAATTQLNLNFTAPVKAGTLTARSEIISMTKRTAVVRIDVHNEGRLAGAAQGTVTITPPR